MPTAAVVVVVECGAVAAGNGYSGCGADGTDDPAEVMVASVRPRYAA